MRYMLLIKLMYLLDRHALLKWGRPVTGAEYFSMKLGPVLSEVLDLINQPPDPDQEGYWKTHISDPADYSVQLVADPGDDDLSEAEEDVIQKLFDKYGGYDPFVLAGLLHDILPEWTRVEQGRVPIPISSILKAKRKSNEEIAAIESDLSAVAKVQRMFAPRR